MWKFFLFILVGCYGEPHPPRKVLIAVPSNHGNQGSFSSRAGVFDSIKSFFGERRDGSVSQSLPPKMRDLHRLPRPPKYPLYDLDAISLATPPPAPVMHPMSSLPSDQFGVAEETVTRERVANQRVGVNRRRQQQGSSHGNRRRGGEPRQPSRRRGPPQNHQRRNDFKKPRPGNHGNKQVASLAPPEFLPHPQASNIAPVQSAPALGRPLSLEEYMARPSTSFTDDPWNFDPFATVMNAGLHTSGLKYNYDPLGTNSVEVKSDSFSHLDPNKLSFPGDAVLKDHHGNGGGVGMYDGGRRSDDDYRTVGFQGPSFHGNNFQGPNFQGPNFHSNQDSSPSASSHTPQTITPSNDQKIEFTIETSPDGQINIQTNNPTLTDQYNPNGAPYGPNGYYSNDAPPDMLPPPSPPGSSFINNNPV